MIKQPEFPALQFVTATLIAFALAASSVAGAQASVEPAPSVAAPVTAPAASLAPVPSAAPAAPDSPTRGTWTVQGAIDASRRNAEAADGQVRIMNEELQTTKTRRDVAKKLKNDADRISLSANTQQQNTEKSYLERLRDALRADADWLESERDAAGARAKAFQAEADVARKLAQISASASTPYPADLSSYRSLLKQMLDAQKNAANKAIDASSKRKEVADKRLKQLEALSKIGR